jgi:hypothetical protein
MLFSGELNIDGSVEQSPVLLKLQLKIFSGDLSSITTGLTKLIQQSTRNFEKNKHLSVPPGKLGC